MKTCFKYILLVFTLLLPLNAARAIKIVHGPYLQNVSETEATIVWIADSLSTGWVELIPDDGSNVYLKERPRFYDTHIGIKTTARIHSVKLTGLKPGTTYRYRIFAQEVLSHKGIHVHYGDVAAASAFMTELPHFTTLDTRKKETSFLVVNDIHERNEVLTKLLEIGDVKSKDIVFFNGDMLSLFDKEAKFFDGFMDTAVKTFAIEKPLYYVRGNHETRGEMADQFHNYVCPREPHLYFTLQEGPVFFICLDTGEDKPDNDWEYAGITDYDNYRSEQALWLQQVISSKEYKQAKFHIVLGHIPPFDNTETVWHGTQEVKDKFVPILNKADIDLMICGHTHEFGFTDSLAGCKFPIVINSNNGVLTGTVNGNNLNIKVQEADGKVSMEKTFTAK
ncbi:MAG: metallophosphoesterase [Prevotella sp.]|jgi:predicted phosphodiesterase|nr:metallophosphoesterase [Prevotella sp.]MCI1282173.1 metallophosphoesterase [Prevotella sp.]